MEVDIAGELVREAITEKRRRGIQNLRIEEEVGTRASSRSPKPEGRIDIKVIYSFDESEYFGIECKRVSGRRSDGLARKYIDNGLMRFVTGKYSSGDRWAGMIGFVIDGQTLASVRLIADEIATRSEELGLDAGWRSETGFGRIGQLYRTRHRRSRPKARIDILHLFLTLN